MPERVRVYCVNRDPNDGTITGIGGFNWRKTLFQAISDININKISYYVEDDDKNEVDIIVAKREGIEYLTTDPDHSEENNLQNLDSCDGYETRLLARRKLKPS